jgi:hypothetical protein
MVSVVIDNVAAGVAREETLKSYPGFIRPILTRLWPTQPS